MRSKLRLVLWFQLRMLFLLALVFCISSWKTDKDAYRLNDFRLRGKVRSVTELRIDPQLQDTLRWVAVFGKQGWLLADSTFTVDRELLFSNSYRYSHAADTVRKRSTSSDEIMVSVNITKNGFRTLHLDTTYYVPSGDFDAGVLKSIKVRDTITTYRFDMARWRKVSTMLCYKPGKPTRIEYYSNGEVIDAIVTYEYDKRGNEIKRTEMGKTQAETIENISVYNTHNDVTEETELYQGTQVRTVYQYSYDKHGNWVKCTSRTGDRSPVILLRSIEYY